MDEKLQNCLSAAILENSKRENLLESCYNEVLKGITLSDKPIIRDKLLLREIQFSDELKNKYDIYHVEDIYETEKIFDEFYILNLKGTNILLALLVEKNCSLVKVRFNSSNTDTLYDTVLQNLYHECKSFIYLKELDLKSDITWSSQGFCSWTDLQKRIETKCDYSEYILNYISSLNYSGIIKESKDKEYLEKDFVGKSWIEYLYGVMVRRLYNKMIASPSKIEETDTIKIEALELFGYAKKSRVEKKCILNDDFRLPFYAEVEAFEFDLKFKAPFLKTVTKYIYIYDSKEVNFDLKDFLKDKILSYEFL